MSCLTIRRRQSGLGRVGVGEGPGQDVHRADHESGAAVAGRGSSHDRPRPDTQCGAVVPSSESPSFQLKLATKDLPPIFSGRV